MTGGSIRSEGEERVDELVALRVVHRVGDRVLGDVGREVEGVGRGGLGGGLRVDGHLGGRREVEGEGGGFGVEDGRLLERERRQRARPVRGALGTREGRGGFSL